MNFIEKFIDGYNDKDTQSNARKAGEVAGSFLKAATETTLTVGVSLLALDAPSIGGKIMLGAVTVYSAVRTVRSFDKSFKRTI